MSRREIAIVVTAVVPGVALLIALFAISHHAADAPGPAVVPVQVHPIPAYSATAPTTAVDA